jgi:hypothetical protein
VADIYKIGVAISLQNNVSAALKIIQKDILGLGVAVDLTQGKLDRLKVAVAGAAAAFVGRRMLNAFKGLANAGGEVLNAQAKMLQIGVSIRDVTQETAVAMQSVNIAGTTLAGNIDDLTKLRGVLGDFQGANMALPGYEKSKFALTGAGIDPSQLPYLVKALDLMGSFNTDGKIDPAKFGPALQQAISAVLTTGGLLTGQGLYQAVRLSGPAASAMGEKAYLQNMVEILLAVGNRGARGLEYGATTFIGGQMSKNSKDMLDRLKLTNEGDYSHEGGRYSLRSNTISGYSELNSGNIIGWIQSYFLPAVKASGMSVLQASATLPQTLQLLITTVANMTPQMARSVAQQAQAAKADPDPYAGAQAAMAGAVDNFQKALASLWQTLGTPAAGIGVTILNDLSAGIRNFNQWVGAHPGYADAMVKTLLGLGVALTALGAAATIGAVAAMVGSGGTIALVVLGLTALAGAFHELPGAIKEVEAGFRGLENFLGIGGPSSPHASIPAPSGIHGAYGRHVPQQLGMNFDDWIAKGAPVTVQNTSDIAKAQDARSSRQLQKPNTGSSGNNLRATPSGSAALAMPGYG